MRLTMNERQPVIREMSKVYHKANKKEKGEILDQFMELTGYRDRSHAAFLLRSQGRRVRISPGLLVVGDMRKRVCRISSRRYDDDVIKALVTIWRILDCICGKRLKPVLLETATRLVRCGEISLSEEVMFKLSLISAPTIDRLLKSERERLSLKRTSLTKPGTLLKSQIPVRMFCEWNEKRPGFMEIDLVGHEGGDAKGDFMWSLDATDVNTGWTEVVAVRNKARVWVCNALDEIRRRLPFELLGIDSDNGAEFINHHLLEYCKNHDITFTRARGYHKNDNCYVEQKNYTVVRRSVGYMRHDTSEELEVVNNLYKSLRLYVNFFTPSMKMLEKTRDGAKVSKRYDTPSTPYQRVMRSSYVSVEAKERLKAQYEKLNPAALKRDMERYQRRLMELVKAKSRREPKTRQDYEREHVVSTGYDGVDAIGL
jgi:hypothetical protein